MKKVKRKKLKCIETEEEIYEITEVKLGWCGCASDKSLHFIKEILEYISVKWNWDEFVEKFFNKKEEAAYCMLFLLHQAKMIEHGAHITGSWLTESGKDYLENLSICIEEILGHHNK